jgi:hypothetical protein
VTAIVDTWPGPAIAGAEAGLVLAANPLARALSPAHRPGTNAYESVFLDARLRDLYVDWPRIADDVVAGLHAASSGSVRARAVAAELQDVSEAFRTRWARHDVRPRPGSGVSRLRHPRVGLLAVRFEKLATSDDPRIGIVLFAPGPSASDATALARLDDG